MKPAITKILLATLCMAWLFSGALHAASAEQVYVQPDLQDHLLQGNRADLILHFDMPDLTRAHEMDWQERGRWVHKVLSAAVESEQHVTRKLLEREGADYESLWMGNMMIVRQADSELLDDMLRRSSQIRAVYPKPEHEIMQGEDGTGVMADVAANLEQIRATDTWDQLGFSGQDIVVGLNDSSPRYTHEVLVGNYRGNLGDGTFDHNYSWFDPGSGVPEPVADSHGTMVQSIVTGISENNVTGVAPDAEWIACRACEGSGCANTVSCLNWMLAPTDVAGNDADPDLRPHVVNNSWGSCPNQGFDYDPATFEPIWDAMYAAGVLPIFANGNASNCGLPAHPGLESVASPAKAGRVLGIGSTTQTGGEYASHSNWGPTDFPNPGMDDGSFDHFGYPELKPNVAAPGQNVVVAGSGSDSQIGTNVGTSFAAPHATGAVAVMLSAAPCLIGDHQTIGNILMSTANWVEYDGGSSGDDPDVEPGVNHPNYGTGWGEIDVFAATEMAIEQCGPRGTLTGEVVDDVTGNPVAGVSIETEDAEANIIMAETDENGLFSMSLVATEGGFTYDVEFSRNGYETLLVTGLEIEEGETINWSTNLVPLAGEAITGEVTDANFTTDGVEASILATDEDGFTYGPVTSDGTTGDYSIELPAGVEYTLTVSAAGYETAERDIGEVTGPMTEDFVLNAGIIELPAMADLTVQRGDTGSTSITIENTGTADAEIDLAFGGQGAVLFEDFEGDFPPDGWTVIDDGSGCPWMTTDDYAMTGWPGAFRAAAVDSDDCGSGTSADTWLITPSMDLSAAGMAELNFDLGINALTATVVTVAASTDGGATWETIASWANEDVAHPDDAALPQSFNLEDFLGESDVQIGFRYQSGWDWYVVVDNVEVTSDMAGAPWADVDPSTVMVPEGGSVDVDLMADASDLEAGTYNIPLMVISGSAYEVDPTDFEVTVEPVPEIVLPESIDMTVEFPTMGTETITVENIGGADGELTLTFLPDPLMEDFEGGDFPPEGWTVTDDSSPACPWASTADINMPANFPGLIAGSTQGAAANSDACGSGVSVDTSLISPVVNLASPVPATITFAFAQNDFGGTTTTVEATADGGDTWEVLETYTGNVNDGEAAYEAVSLAPMAGNPEVQVRFRYVSGWDWYVYVDDVEIELPSTEWAEANPDVFMVDANDSAQTDVVVDSSLLDGPGTYTATLFGLVDSPIGIAPSELTVTVVPGTDLAGIQGTVMTQGYCDGNPDIAPGAEITVTGATETWTTFADENGEYIIYVDSAEGFVDVTASAANHIAFTEEDVELVEASEVTVNFDLLLDEPCIDTDPAEFTSSMEPNETDIQTLTISNNGAGELDWTLDASQPNVVSANDGSGGLFASDGASAAAAMDFAGQFGDELPTVRGMSPFTLIDCEDAPGLVIADDGSIDNGYSGNPAVATDVTVVQGYEADGDRLLGVVCVSFLSTGPDSRDYEIVVFESDGGVPGTELGSVSGTATSIPSGLPDPGDPITWYTLDLSPLNILLEDGAEVFIGTRWEVSDPNVFLASDEEGPGGNTGFFRIDGEAWDELGTADAFIDYASLFVRPQLLSPTGCDTINEVSWLSFDPAAGTTAANGSSEVDVIIDSSGLFPGDYEANVCVFSNDTIGGTQAVPVSLTVEAPESFATITGQVQSAGYCDENPFPAAGATVVVEGQDNTFTVTADGDGMYMVALDSAESPVDITASAPDHIDGVETGVTLGEGDELVVDFELTLEAGCTSNDPESFDVTVAQNGNATEILSLINAGAGDSSFAISSIEFAGMNAEPVLLELERAARVSEGSSREGMRSTESVDLPASSRSVEFTPLGQAINVLLVTPDDNIGDLESALSAFPDLDVTVFTGDLATVAGADFEPYDVVVTTNNTQWAAQNADVSVGDALADYVDEGGTVILNNFAYDFDLWSLAGRFITEDYGPFTGTSADNGGTSSLGTVHMPEHPIMDGVSAVTNSFLWQNPSVASGADLIADWDDGSALVAANEHSVAFNVLPSDGDGEAGWTGDLDLMYYNAIVYLSGGAGEPAEWLSFDPATGSVVGGGSTDVDVLFDADGLAAGMYEADILVEVDEGAGQSSTLTIPVTMEVMEEDPMATVNGIVMSLGHCGADPQPAAGAAIFVDGQENSFTATADASGYFEMDIPADEGPVDVTADAMDHLPQTESGVVIVSGETTTVDFDMVLEAACATVMPEEMDFMLSIDDLATQALTIGNIEGGSSLTWSLASGNGCFDGSEGWLSVSSTGDTIGAGSSQSIDVTADSTGLAAGVYETTLCMDTNDAEQPEIQVPVTVMVQGAGIFHDRFEVQD